MSFKITLIVAALLCCLIACKKSDIPTPTLESPGVVNINGKDYKTVKIGTQTWTVESYAGNGGVVYGPTAKSEYGKYYTYTEVKAITLPAGWRLPSMDDYKTMGQVNGINFSVGAENTEAAKKLISKTGWNNALGSNASGLNMLPGNMIYNDVPGEDGDVAEFWTASGSTFSIMETGANGRLLNVQFFGNSNMPEYRFPARFVKD